MSRKSGGSVPNQEGVSHGAPGEAVSGPSTGRPSGPISPSALVKPEGGVQRVFLSIDVPCFVCGVRAGQQCKDRDGKPAVISHNSRADRAEKLTKRWAAWHGDRARNAELPPL